MRIACGSGMGISHGSILGVICLILVDTGVENCNGGECLIGATIGGVSTTAAAVWEILVWGLAAGEFGLLRAAGVVVVVEVDVERRLGAGLASSSVVS